MFKRALVSSDIIISSISLQERVKTRKRKSLPPEVLELLVINNTDIDEVSSKDGDIITGDAEDENECNKDLEIIPDIDNIDLVIEDVNIE